MNVGILKKLSKLGLMGSAAVCAALSAVIFTASPASAATIVEYGSDAVKDGCASEIYGGEIVNAYCTDNKFPWDDGHHDLIVWCTGERGTKIVAIPKSENKEIPNIASVTCSNLGIDKVLVK